MATPGSINELLIGAAGAAGGYEISRSVRFNSADSAYLNRTPASAGNRKTWTWAGWVKRTAPGTGNYLFMSQPDASNYSEIYFDTDNSLKVSNRVGGVDVARRFTSAVYRDVSAWYHIVVASNSSSLLKIYVNGVEVTNFSTSTGPTTADWSFNSTSAHGIGANSAGSGYFLNGYLADIHLIDGQALDPTSFGRFDTNAVWQPKAYSGSYGTNGFHLDFADNSTAAALGTDTSGNSNTWTVNNISVAAGAGNDSLVDTPTSYGTDTGAGGEVRGNYCTWNPVNSSSLLTPANGNLELTGTGAGATYGNSRGSIALNDSKYYWETVVAATRTYQRWGIAPTDTPCENGGSEALGNNDIPNSVGLNCNTGSVSVNSSTVYTGSGALASGAIVGHAFDGTSGKYWISVNGAWLTGNPATNTTPITTVSLTRIWQPAASDATSQTLVANFGQRPFAYTAPSGFKALCTTNLPEPTIAKPSEVMDVKLYTANRSTNNITGLGFSPDLVWIKGRQSQNHMLFDTVRTAGKSLNSNLAAAEETFADTLTSFNSDGFTLGPDSTSLQVNYYIISYAAWCWDAGSSTVTNTQGSITSSVRANASSGFSVVTYPGALSGAGSSTIGHGLGVAPSLVIVKNRDAAENWVVYHQSLGNAAYVVLNSTSAQVTGSSLWGTTSPTSSVFTAGYSSQANLSGNNYVAYCFAPVAGYSAFGSYTGNGTNQFVYLGFRPKLVLIKGTTTTSAFRSWNLADSSRPGYNPQYQNMLWANRSSAEGFRGDGSTTADVGQNIDLLSNGFRLTGGGGEVNNSNEVFVYAAWAESPFQYARAR